MHCLERIIKLFCSSFVLYFVFIQKCVLTKNQFILINLLNKTNINLLILHKIFIVTHLLFFKCKKLKLVLL